jgi:hypothetical protein
MRRCRGVVSGPGFLGDAVPRVAAASAHFRLVNIPKMVVARIFRRVDGGAGDRPVVRNNPSDGGLLFISRTYEHAMPFRSVMDRDPGFGSDLATEPRCPVCGSPAFAYPKTLDDNHPVLCARCGAFVSTYGEMKQRDEE